MQNQDSMTNYDILSYLEDFVRDINAIKNDRVKTCDKEFSPDFYWNIVDNVNEIISNLKSQKTSYRPPLSNEEYIELERLSGKLIGYFMSKNISDSNEIETIQKETSARKAFKNTILVHYSEMDYMPVLIKFIGTIRKYLGYKDDKSLTFDYGSRN